MVKNSDIMNKNEHQRLIEIGLSINLPKELCKLIFSYDYIYEHKLERKFEYIEFIDNIFPISDKYVITSQTYDDYLRVLDTKTGEVLHTLGGEIYRFYDLKIIDDNKVLFLHYNSSIIYTIEIWDPISPRFLTKISLDFEATFIEILSKDNDGIYILAYNDTKGIISIYRYLFNDNTIRILKSIKIKGMFKSLSIIPNNKFILTSLKPLNCFDIIFYDKISNEFICRTYDLLYNSRKNIKLYKAIQAENIVIISGTYNLKNTGYIIYNFIYIYDLNIDSCVHKIEIDRTIIDIIYIGYNKVLIIHKDQISIFNIINYKINIIHKSDIILNYKYSILSDHSLAIYVYDDYPHTTCNNILIIYDIMNDIEINKFNTDHNYNNMLTLPNNKIVFSTKYKNEIHIYI